MIDPTGKLSAVFGRPVDEGALGQIVNVLADERAVAGALMADHHLGYSMPIGGVVAYRDAISPSGVGFDIACGNKAVRTTLEADVFRAAIPQVMRQIKKNVAFGLGRSNPEPVDDPLFDSWVWDEIDTKPGQPLKQKAAAQLGTVGSGNHYVDLLEDDDGFLWVACHFGSRGLGHTIASGFLAIAAGGSFDDRVRESEEPAVLDMGTDSGRLYAEAMELAGDYAYAGRNYVVDQVLGVLGNPDITFSVHCHHNYAWLEDTDAYGPLWFVRKGATPLTDDPAFIGGSMGDVSVVVRGRDENIGALGSAPHGAGRVMSRTRAAGKLRKLWYCNNRNCGFKPEHHPGGSTPYEKNRCPECGLPLRQGRMRDPSTAEIDWQQVRVELKDAGVTVLGGGADEAPGVYKRLDDVIAQHTNIEVLHRLRPLGVVMASPDVRDPYKD